MTAKEKILKGIALAAESKAGAIISEAEKNADEGVDAALGKAHNEGKKIIAEAEKRAMAIKNNADSSAALLRRDTALKFKSDAINSVLEKAAQRLNSYSDKEYFDFLYSLAKKNVLPRAGVLYLGEADSKREKKEFQKQIANLKLTLSDESCDIKGGFMLKYDDVIINCAFSALINERKERLIDVINKELFG